MRGQFIDIDPPRAQVGAGRLALTDKMELVPVEDDVLNVSRDLKKIDAGLSMFFNVKDKVYVLFWKGLNERGEVVEDFVGAYQHLDERIVNLIKRISARETSDRYEFTRELERLDAQREAEQNHRHAERVGPMAEELRFALRKDLGVTNQAYMSAPRKGKRKKKR